MAGFMLLCEIRARQRIRLETILPALGFSRLGLGLGLWLGLGLGLRIGLRLASTLPAREKRVSVPWQRDQVLAKACGHSKAQDLLRAKAQGLLYVLRPKACSMCPEGSHTVAKFRLRARPTPVTRRLADCVLGGHGLLG